MSATLSGAEFKKQLRGGTTEAGPVPELAQPDGRRAARAQRLRLAARRYAARTDGQRDVCPACSAGIANGGATSMVRVGGYSDRAGHSAVAGHGRRWRARAVHQHG